MADILSSQYQSVFTTPRQDPIYTGLAITDTLLSDFEISPIDIKEAIRSIDASSAAGPDGVTPRILKDYVDELVGPLAILYRRSIDSGEPLDGINMAHIAPIFKGGQKSKPSNYRPVALTNHITKVLEWLIKSKIVHHLTS